jgi:hypothetical protein
LACDKTQKPKQQSLLNIVLNLTSMENINQINNQGHVPAKPNNYLALSIITTVMCCMPLGIVSIIKSTKVDGLYHAGKYQEAEETSRSAKNWALAGIGIIGIVWLLYILFLVLVGVSGNM